MPCEPSPSGATPALAFGEEGIQTTRATRQGTGEFRETSDFLEEAAVHTYKRIATGRYGTQGHVTLFFLV